MKKRKHVRNFQDFSFEGVWPHQGLNPDPEESLRHQAIEEVLSCIPEEDYIKLKEAFNNSYEWFIPPEVAGGMAYPFYATVYPPDEGESKPTEAPYVPVVYLCPTLEKKAWRIVLAVVAHELAHIALEHKLRCSADEYDTQEKAAWEKICEWGFEKEAKKHQAMHEKSEAKERLLIEKYKEKMSK